MRAGWFAMRVLLELFQPATRSTGPNEKTARRPPSLECREAQASRGTVSMKLCRVASLSASRATFG